MTPQALIIGQDNSVYYDLIALALILVFCMTACSLWLVHRKRSLLYISAVWAGFLLLLSLGTLGVSRSIHAQRLLWRDSCSRLIATYANIVMQQDHWTTQPGHPEVFSDWSPHFLLTSDSPPPLPFELDRNFSSEPQPILTKLAVPDGCFGGWQNMVSHDNKPLQCLRRNQWAVATLTQDCRAFDRCTRQIVARWNPVPNATTYRLQWGVFRGEATEWLTVYTGAKPFCAVTAPNGVEIALRVRAEDGTPEDDPDFNRIIDILDFPVRVDSLVCYTYTLRVTDQGELQFISAPISDANHNGFIDAEEKPTDIGEIFPMTPHFKYVLEHGQRTLSMAVDVDDWGRWFTIAEPLWTPDGKIDGILGMDFNIDLVRRRMLLDRIYPMSLFLLVSFSYFGAALVISSLQMRTKTISRLAEILQNTNAELTESQHMTEKALQVKSLFLTNMSHEFRTPLNAMLGFTEIIAMCAVKCVSDKRESCEEAIQQMRVNGQNLVNMVENVLIVAAMGETQTMLLKVTPVHLRSLISEIADTFRCRAESKSLSFTVVDSPDLPEWIESDPAHIRQVLILLIANAIKFTQQGGVTIRYGVSQEPNVLFISVSDTGIGIKEDQLQSIFQPFSQSDSTLTRKYGGTGIGLSVAVHSAGMLNGSISVESQPEQGSTFTFTFPGKAIPAPPQEVPKVHDVKTLPPPQLIQTDTLSAPLGIQSVTEMKMEMMLAGCRILYVDDTRVNQIIMVPQMEEAGASIELADNGQMGIDKIATADQSGNPYDIILMDLQMPVMDGYEATQRLRANGYSKPIIAVTAHALSGDREKALEAGCSEYITKPVDYGRLVKMICGLWKK